VIGDIILTFAIPIVLIMSGFGFLLGIDPIGNRVFRNLRFRRRK
jgi:hypothetical protein